MKEIESLSEYTNTDLTTIRKINELIAEVNRLKKIVVQLQNQTTVFK